jgi:hypothetical protein
MDFMVYRSGMDPIKKSREGLCSSCRHRKENRSDRGSIFIFCRKSESDRRFPKYPPLPVRACDGHEPAGS